MKQQLGEIADEKFGEILKLFNFEKVSDLYIRQITLKSRFTSIEITRKISTGPIGVVLLSPSDHRILVEIGTIILRTQSVMR